MKYLKFLKNWKIFSLLFCFTSNKKVSSVFLLFSSVDFSLIFKLLLKLRVISFLIDSKSNSSKIFWIFYLYSIVLVLISLELIVKFSKTRFLEKSFIFSSSLFSIKLTTCFLKSLVAESIFSIFAFCSLVNLKAIS
ncbi:putative transmembrane protein [Mycoplasma mycoides subsp. mycoides KH3J]|uniref:Uncharacterized protein n=2 Tax=Mycoplasma mycoides subsp. mycoides TaxID=2103 RepID=A0AAE2JTK6_MYCMY|nr:hypothetical protein mycmycITA_00485 [Mycoplasma mycoides subsp. mycoides]PTD32448.1 putative transmembrane protein [Mycoplasma mycoides subsp. mycoides C425/93]PTD32502.1 putative transmembrane protein [Mycoplasma mycoides subsp. mycoides B345/93]PTD33628.1 putative transmembrane protein [Mycoplasma mycoides subsp. mycoides KH3J]PTD33803.1 putative transmembrane protein [Mycoplasma mycoides subsp. mycoides PO-67]PTD33977.1 putative transmembrane protein [Mycoplasma mycoides subsp. mycoides